MPAFFGVFYRLYYLIELDAFLYHVQRFLVRGLDAVIHHPAARLLHQFEQFNIHPVASRVAGPLQVEFFPYHGLAQFHDVFPLEGEGAVLEIHALAPIFFRQ